MGSRVVVLALVAGDDRLHVPDRRARCIERLPLGIRGQRPTRHRRAVWIPIAFSNPLMSYSFLIFTELPTGLLVIYSFRRLALGWRGNSGFRLVLVGFAIAYIPWLAPRGATLAAGLALYAAVQWWRSGAGRVDLAFLCAPLGLSILLLGYYYWFLYYCRSATSRLHRASASRPSTGPGRACTNSAGFWAEPQGSCSIGASDFSSTPRCTCSRYPASSRSSPGDVGRIAV